MAILLVGMLVCPAIDAAQTGDLKKSESHCGNEKPSVPEQVPMIQCCCDQNAISVGSVHAPEDDPVLHALKLSSSAIQSILIPEEHDPLPYQNAGHYLSKLSVLRL